MIGINCVPTKLEQVKAFLIKYGLPKLPQNDLVNYAKFLSKRVFLEKHSEFADFYEFFVNQRISHNFSRAIVIQCNPFLWRIVTASIFLRKSSDDIVRFCKIDKPILELFKFYFMNLDKMDLFDINHYINLLSDWNQQLLSTALEGDEARVMWMLRQIPSVPPAQMVQDIAVHAYYNYLKWSKSDKIINNKIAKDYGDMAIKAVIVGGETIKPAEQLQFRYVFRDLYASKMIVPREELPKVTITDIEPANKRKH